ncbi:MAG: NAD-dependent epimerase/dehydratase family protein [Vicinamibacterales bacterium]
MLITGAAGFVGANLAARCLSDGCDVYALIRPGTDRWRLAALETGVRLVELDLRDGPAVRQAVAAARPDWVFHTAVHGAYSWQTDSGGILDTNVVGTAHLLEACADVGFAALVNSGTSSEYGHKDHPAAETEPAEPLSRYAVSKLCATEYCRFFARSLNLPVATLRLYSVFGPYEDPRRLIPTLIVRGLSGQLPPLAHRGVSHDFIYIDDVCDAFVKVAAGPPKADAAIYNVGTGVHTTLGDVVDLARSRLPIDATPEWESMRSREWDTDVWVANPDRMADACGWRATFSLADGFQRFIDWFTANPRMLDYYRGRQGAQAASPPKGG